MANLNPIGSPFHSEILEYRTKAFLPQIQTSFWFYSRKNLPQFPHTPLPNPNPKSRILYHLMGTSVISDAISSIAYSTQSLGFSNFLNRPHNVFSLSDTSSDQPPKSPPPFHISAASPPPTRTLTKRRLRRTRRVRRRIVIDYDGEENGIFVFTDGGGFNSGDGYFGSGGGGKGWNFGGYGGTNWEGFSENSVPDPAFDFGYEVLCWIAMSNCLDFAFKKVVRFVADGFGDRGKVPMRLTPVC